MSNSKFFTWKADIRMEMIMILPHDDNRNCASAGPEPIAVIRGNGGVSEPGGYRLITPEQVKNAYTLAAAPDLLAILEDVLDSWRYGESTTEAHKVYDKAVGILRQAKGEVDTND